MKISIEEIKRRIFNIHGDKIALLESSYVNVVTQCIFIDKEYGKWKAVPNKIINNKQGHPRRKFANLKILNIKSLELIKQKLEKIHSGNVAIDERTYLGSGKKARFIDIKYGEWYAVVNKVVNGGHVHPNRKGDKQKNTCIKKYGVDNPSKVLEISLKGAKNSTNKYTKFHWKTNEELICQASYEAKVVDYLNENKIDFKWQPQIFKMPDGKTYRPDMYLVKEDKWIEIKGFFRKDAKEKWDWFQSIMPNSELWNKEVLVSMGIL